MIRHEVECELLPFVQASMPLQETRYIPLYLREGVAAETNRSPITCAGTWFGQIIYNSLLLCATIGSLDRISNSRIGGGLYG
jgi:hypothetical protein